MNDKVYWIDAASVFVRAGKMDVEAIRRMLGKACELAVDVKSLDENADLYAAGLTSFASVQLMLALEEEFDVEFPDRLLNRKTFATIRSICETVDMLRSEREAA